VLCSSAFDPQSKRVQANNGVCFIGWVAGSMFQSNACFFCFIVHVMPCTPVYIRGSVVVARTIGWDDLPILIAYRIASHRVVSYHIVAGNQVCVVEIVKSFHRSQAKPSQHCNANARSGLHYALFAVRWRQLFEDLENFSDPPGRRAGHLAAKGILPDGFLDRVKDIVLLVNEIEPGIGSQIELKD